MSWQSPRGHSLRRGRARQEIKVTRPFMCVSKTLPLTRTPRAALPRTHEAGARCRYSADTASTRTAGQCLLATKARAVQYALNGLKPCRAAAAAAAETSTP